MTPTTENWRPVLGYEGLYEVSDLGRVRSVDRLIATKAGPAQRHRGRLLRVRLNRFTGRRLVTLSQQSQQKTRTVYPLVLEAFVGPRPPGMEACHNDGNSQNDRLDNLRWDTRRENALDTVKHGANNNANKTHCKRGHRLEQPNLVENDLARGHRRCKACARTRGDYATADQHYRRIMQDAPNGDSVMEAC